MLNQKIILQITTIHNAVRLGWTVRVADNKRIVLRKKIKKMTHLDKNTKKLVELLMDLRV